MSEPALTRALQKPKIKSTSASRFKKHLRKRKEDGNDVPGEKRPNMNKMPTGWYVPGIVDPADLPDMGPVERALRAEKPDDGTWDFIDEPNTAEGSDETLTGPSEVHSEDRQNGGNGG